MCRILLNVVLMKYASVVVGIGETEADRETYMEIVRRRSSDDCGAGEFAAFVLGKSLGVFERAYESLVDGYRFRGGPFVTRVQCDQMDHNFITAVLSIAVSNTWSFSLARHAEEL